MPQPPVILDASGRPMPPAARPRGAAPRMRASLSGKDSWAFPYDAASWYQRETEGWYPYPYSPDHEINIHRDRMVGRVRDIVRNDGWASGAVSSVLDSTIGGNYRLVAQPDYRALRRYSKGFDAVWAAEFRHAVEAEWRSWSEDPVFYCDASREMTVSQMIYLAFRHALVDGEPLAALEWHPERIGYGAAHYATAIRLLDPDRLSNPYDQIDTQYLRGGVELDDDGAPIAYHIRRAHQFDWYNAVKSMIWDRVERFTEWGRPVIIHSIDRDRATQHRGLSVFIPVVNRFKMLTRYDAAELQAAVINAILSMVVTSPYDPEGMKDALEDSGDQAANWYWTQRSEFRRGKPLVMDDARVISLFPGEAVTPVMSTRPSAQYDPFMHAILRSISGPLGTTAEQLTKDWSRTNYSSARGAIVEAFKTVSRRRYHFNGGFCRPMYSGWLEEAMDVADLPLPAGAPDFVEARAAYSRCRWIGAPRGWIDPVKEAQGAVLRMDAGVSTLEQECAEQGHDWEEMLDQRALERRRMGELGIPYPAWIAGIPAAGGDDAGASQAAQKPEKPEAN